MFTVFENSTTGFGNEATLNFYHFADGSRLPRGGDTLEPTDSVFDLGTSLYKWKNIYCNNLVVNNSISSSGLLYKVYTLVLSSGSAELSRVAITGLNGDNTNYMINVQHVPKNSTSVMELRMNQSSGTTDYIERAIQFEKIGNTIASYITTGAAQMRVCHSTTRIESSFFQGYLYSKTGQQRILDGIEVQNNGNVKRRITQVWDNTVDTLTSISFVATGTLNFSLGMRIKIWEVE